MNRKIALCILMLSASPAMATREADATMPSKWGCVIVRGFFAHWLQKGYTLAQMKAFLRSNGISEARIATAEKCLVEH